MTQACASAPGATGSGQRLTRNEHDAGGDERDDVGDRRRRPRRRVRSRRRASTRGRQWTAASSGSGSAATAPGYPPEIGRRRITSSASTGSSRTCSAWPAPGRDHARSSRGRAPRGTPPRRPRPPPGRRPSTRASVVWPVWSMRMSRDMCPSSASVSPWYARSRKGPAPLGARSAPQRLRLGALTVTAKDDAACRAAPRSRTALTASVIRPLLRSSRAALGVSRIATFALAPAGSRICARAGDRGPPAHLRRCASRPGGGPEPARGPAGGARDGAAGVDHRGGAAHGQRGRPGDVERVRGAMPAAAPSSPAAGPTRAARWAGRGRRSRRSGRRRRRRSRPRCRRRRRPGCASRGPRR